jgi:hypothetical protein
MSTRGLVKELLVSYLNTRKINSAPIKDITAYYKPHVKGVDLYRTLYHIASHDAGFRVENDGLSTWVVMG